MGSWKDLPKDHSMVYARLTDRIILVSVYVRDMMSMKEREYGEQ
jgi:hypothetical protein